MVRGWTSEIKTFQVHQNKDKSFHKIEKGFHLTLNEKPLKSSVDVWGLNAVTISGDGEQLKLWNLLDQSHIQEVTVEGYQINMVKLEHCAIATLKMENERLKTLVIVAGGNKMVVLDRRLKVVTEF